MNIVILQPPLVQLNSPYPSGAYLSAFFRRLQSDHPEYTIESVRWYDVSIALFHRMFSAEGCAYIFQCVMQKTLTKDAAEFALPYISMRAEWIRWMPVIIRILCTSERELCHEFVRSPSVPRAKRMNAYLALLETEVRVDDARFLASLAIEDFADFITAVFDEHFSLVRYGESLAVSTAYFTDIEKALDAPVLLHFLKPLLNELFISLDTQSDSSFLFCISVPFPGTVPSAFFIGQEIGSYFGKRAMRVLGGGYVNTELRSVSTKNIYRYIDLISYDRGYASYYALFETYPAASTESLIKILETQKSFGEYERRISKEIAPDYRDIDFTQYPRLCDDTNPMHRLWSDGTWLKAYAAHGCYWHRCSFCDVTLDYVCAYIPVDIPHLYRSLIKQADEKKVYGVHFVDEAAPPRALRDFAVCNIRRMQEKKTPLSFWGNIRFEKTFSRDSADLLSYGGMVGVTGGIEIATGGGLRSIDKGTDIEHLVAACAAFKEAGMLVHAYMIYGYWEETAQQLIDSAETLRQLFEHGLLDSAFWHKFTLTRHSRLFSEWKRGMHTDLKPLLDDERNSDFAQNDIRFKGENVSEKYTEPLDNALSAWMDGESFEVPIQQWFPFAMPKPSIAPDFITQHIGLYEKRRDREFSQKPDSARKYMWLAGYPVAVKNAVRWIYMGEEFELIFSHTEKAADAVCTLSVLKDGGGSVWADGLSNAIDEDTFLCLRGKGLCMV